MIKSGRLWPWALGLVLGLTVAGNFWVMKLAGSEPSMAVEPDYYQKALAWDSTVNQQRINAALGWLLESKLTEGSGDGARPTVEVVLKNAAGEPIDSAVISVEATHNARAGEIYKVRLAAQGMGSYRATLESARRGIWQLRFEVTAGGERFTAVRRVETIKESTDS